jgi:hypothetical protein
MTCTKAAMENSNDMSYRDQKWVSSIRYELDSIHNRWESQWMFCSYYLSYFYCIFFKFHPPFFLICIIGINRLKEKFHRKTRNICWIAHCQLCLKNISYRPIHPRKYVEPLIVNCAWRIFPTDPSTPEYMLNRSLSINNEQFNIYSGMDGSVGNILQAQLTMSGSTYFLGWVGL